MSVKFAAVSFQNKNGIDITVAIEAPIGTTVVRETVVPPDATVMLPINRDDCASVAIIASDTHASQPESFRQVFEARGEPTPGYLVSVELEYGIGSFKGGFTAHTR